MWKIWYPSSANKDNLYVYLNTLNRDNPGLYAAAKALVNANNQGDSENGFKLENALQFLKLAAENEATKEINFLRSKFDDKTLSEILDGNTINYPKMIAKLNEANKTLEKYKIQLEQELARFERVQAARKVEKKKVTYKLGEGKYSYTQGFSGYAQAAMRQMVGLSRARTDKISQICRTILINKMNMIKDLSSLNVSQMATIIGLAQAEIMPFLEEELKKGTLSNDNNDKLDPKKIEEIVNKNNAFNKLYSKQADELISISNRILGKFGQRSDLDGKELEKAITNLKRIQIGNIRSEANKNVRALLSGGKTKMEDIGLTIKFKAKNSNTGMALEYAVANELSNALVTGESGGKIDVSALDVGSFEIGLTIQNSKAYQDAMKAITKDTQGKFGEVGEKFMSAYQQINDFLKNAQQKNNEMEQAFILHANVKDYYSTATSEFKGFEGGTYKGLQIFDSIEALASAGFGDTDIQWLKACAVNTSKSAVGASIKSSLEKYLSIFATMLLFDDGLTIAQETVANAQASFAPLNVLHLFNLNGFYVPSSYILNEMYYRLTTIADDLCSDKLIKVSIFPGSINFQDELDYLSINYVFRERRWEAIRDIQINAMSVRINFLRNFMDILNNLTGA